MYTEAPQLTERLAQSSRQQWETPVPNQTQPGATVPQNEGQHQATHWGPH